jgi:hypothetical protein
MEAVVQVKLRPGAPLVPAKLTTERSESSYGQPVVLVEGETNARGTAEVEAVYVMADTPAKLVDAAVRAGFYVLGQPRGNSAAGGP